MHTLRETAGEPTDENKLLRVEFLPTVTEFDFLNVEST
jgi:hypothetical protein